MKHSGNMPREKHPNSTMIESLESRIAPATFIVTNLSDSGPGSLRAVIALANDRAGADVIVFEPGLTGQINLTTGEMLISDTLTIRGPGPDKLSVDAQGVSRILNARNFEADLSLSVSGVTFLTGDATAGDSSGGAILSIESLKVKNCVFASNDAARQGGAIAVEQPPGNPINVEIRQSSFFNNSNQAFGGGAVSIEVGGRVVVKQCVFSGNTSDTRAGALSIGKSPEGQGGILVEKCQFLGNRADEHGALGISNGDGEAVVRGNVFIGNQATGDSGFAGAVAIFGGEVVFDRNLLSQNSAFQQGGGLFTGQFTSLTISHCRFLDNVSELSGFTNGGGGALTFGFAEPGVSARIISSIFSGNSSTKGGAIFVSEFPLPLKIVATTIANNHSETDGGGIFVAKNSGTNVSASIDVVKSTITGNTAVDRGGGVFADGDGNFSVKSSKVTNNVADAGGGLYLANTAKVLIADSLIAKNLSETMGGGIAAIAELELRDSQVLGNTAKQDGGGIHSFETLLIADCVISGNLSSRGSGVFQESSDPLTITKSKVRGNISSDGEQVVDA
jgi:predicted outer membrane repeat protein